MSVESEMSSNGNSTISLGKVSSGHGNKNKSESVVQRGTCEVLLVGSCLSNKKPRVLIKGKPPLHFYTINLCFQEKHFLFGVFSHIFFYFYESLYPIVHRSFAILFSLPVTVRRNK